MATHFIADLHLQSARPQLLDVFHRYLAGPARAADALYILGDLFEVWSGDDASLADYQTTIDALATLANSGVNLYFMRGNRDFAVGPGFEQAAGIRILEDPLLIDLYGTPTLISHGDMFCTDDQAHQAFRRKYTNPVWRLRMLRLPKWFRRALARQARAKSRANTRRLPERIMDVNVAAVRTAMHANGAQRLIHGHTHRPGMHKVELGGTLGERFVLGDWRQIQSEHPNMIQGSVLVCDAEGCLFQRLE